MDASNAATVWPARSAAARTAAARSARARPVAPGNTQLGSMPAGCDIVHARWRMGGLVAARP
eukprot:6197524-Pleurochrysis_carterae.AAC.1